MGQGLEGGRLEERTQSKKNSLAGRPRLDISGRESLVNVPGSLCRDGRSGRADHLHGVENQDAEGQTATRAPEFYNFEQQSVAAVNCRKPSRVYDVIVEKIYRKGITYVKLKIFEKLSTKYYNN